MIYICLAMFQSSLKLKCERFRDNYFSICYFSAEFTFFQATESVLQIFMFCGFPLIGLCLETHTYTNRG